MTQRVPNPGGSGGVANLAPIGTASYEIAGTYTVTPPAGTKFIRFLARGGGGGGGGSSSAGGQNGGGGGQGALQRRFLRLTQPSFQLTVGAGGAYGFRNAGTDQPTAGGTGGTTSVLGFSAVGGSGGGTSAYNNVGAGGVGADGNQPPVGYGNFSGESATNTFVGAVNSPTSSYGANGIKGNGGNGAIYNSGTNNGVRGGAGGDGTVYMEFFG